MNMVKAWAVLAAAAACNASAMASDECASTKKAIEAKLSSRGVKDYTLVVVDAKTKVPGKTVGHCDGRKRKIVYASGDAAGDLTAQLDARISTTAPARNTLDAKAALAAKAASEAAAAEAKAASAANLAAEAKAAASRAAAEARAAAIEARTAAETRAAAAARVAADAQAMADAAAGEARAASDAKAAADAWAVAAAKAATEAATAASKAAADAKVAAELKSAAQLKAAAAAQKAAAEARQAANARAAADAIPVDPADMPGILVAVGSGEARPATAAAVMPARAIEVRAAADTRFAADGLQYDGVYRAPVNVNGSLSWKYFRFYPDGTFITVRSAGTPEQLRQWFVREEPNNERGIIKVQGARLLFYTPEGAAASYDGSMEAGQVVINTKGRTGQNQHSDTYEFVRWPAGGVVPATAVQGR